MRGLLPDKHFPGSFVGAAGRERALLRSRADAVPAHFYYSDPDKAIFTGDAYLGRPSPWRNRVPLNLR